MGAGYNPTEMRVSVYRPGKLQLGGDVRLSGGTPDSRGSKLKFARYVAADCEKPCCLRRERHLRIGSTKHLKRTDDCAAKRNCPGRTTGNMTDGINFTDVRKLPCHISFDRMVRSDTDVEM